jgi:hypothetical protein
MARLTLYEREGCHLCDEARDLLDQLIGPGSYARLPVIALDGKDRLEAPITGPDVRALARELQEPMG